MAKHITQKKASLQLNYLCKALKNTPHEIGSALLLDLILEQIPVKEQLMKNFDWKRSFISKPLYKDFIDIIKILENDTSTANTENTPNDEPQAEPEPPTPTKSQIIIVEENEPDVNQLLKTLFIIGNLATKEIPELKEDFLKFKEKLNFYHTKENQLSLFQ